MCRKILLKLLLAFPILIFAQDRETDSLNQIVKTSKDDSIRVRALNKLAFAQVFKDTAQAQALLNKSAKLAAGKSRCRVGYVEMLSYSGVMHDIAGHQEAAERYMKQALQLSRKYGFANLEVRVTNNMGMMYRNRGAFQDALRYFLESQSANERLPQKDQMRFDISYSNIGLVYQELGMYRKALDYHNKAFAFRKQNQMWRDQAISLNNIGICYHALEQVQRAVDVYREGLVAAKKAQDEFDYCKILSNLGNAYQSQEKFRQAIACYDEVLHYPLPERELLITYSNACAAYNFLGQPKKGQEYAARGFKLLQEHPEIESVAKHLYQYAAQSEYMLGNIRQGEAYNAKFIRLTEAVFSDENAQLMADYEIKYQTARKEKELAQNKAKLLESEARTRQRSFLLAAALTLVLFIVLIALLVIRQQRQRQRQLEQEHRLKSAIAEIETQNQLQEQRLAISRDLHDNIGAQLTFIISSVENIRYAFDTAHSKLGDKLEGISDFAKSTILELRDTIWAMNSTAITFEDLKGRALNFIEKAQSVKEDVVFEFKVDESLDGQTLSAVAGMNVYRTLQEAVNNAIKYAHPNKIAIAVNDGTHDIQIQIVDDGTGFDLQNILPGNGLSNMRKRIEDIGGRCDIQSKPGQGTRITLVLAKKHVLS